MRDLSSDDERDSDGERDRKKGGKRSGDSGRTSRPKRVKVTRLFESLGGMDEEDADDEEEYLEDVVSGDLPLGMFRGADQCF